MLFDRAWSLDVGGIRVISTTSKIQLNLKFEVVKSTAREPNTCNIQIANLAPSTLQRLEELDEPQVELWAGYRDLEDVIYVGDARDIFTVRDGVDRWTHIESEDGGQAYRTARISRSFAANTPVRTVIAACAGALGVGQGNTAEVAARATLENGENIYATGITLDGPASRSLDSVCRSCSLRWSVQNGVLQLREQGRPAVTRAVRISPGTGLLGSPTRAKRDERTGRVTITVKCMLIPGLYPGRIMHLDSSDVRGDYMIKRVRFAGDTNGPDWIADCEVEEYA